MSWEIRQGDALERLREMPDRSVQMCATSPPYYGLRDYGTAAWEGGDPNCGHQQEPPRFNGPKQTAAQVSGHASNAEAHNRQQCPKCGARRVDRQIGLEQTPEEFVGRLVEVFREVRRVLRDDGTCWINLGDSYAANRAYQVNGTKQTKNSQPRNGREVPPGLKPKDLIGIPWMVAFALRADGWYLRSDIIWAKLNPMPESVTDRPTKAHEYVFLLTKAERYFYDAEAIKEPVQSGPSDIRKMEEGLHRIDAKHFHVDPGPLAKAGPQTNIGQKRAVGDPSGRNKRSVWTVNTQPCKEAHFAIWPPKLVEIMVKAGTSEKGCCPACGAPWWRVVEKGEESKVVTRGNTPWAAETGQRDAPGGLPHRTSVTTGWQPGCTCGAGDPSPCTVLDPFSGAGTTGLVALNLGRNYLGIELNPEYLEISKRRLAKVDAYQPDLFAASQGNSA